MTFGVNLSVVPAKSLGGTWEKLQLSQSSGKCIQLMLVTYQAHVGGPSPSHLGDLSS